jgi:ABC-2 type transport system ATP-binding protein
MTEASPLQTHNIVKRYGDNLVLNDVSLSLVAGEIFGLIGLNGVGKTTLIKILLDLTRADQGETLLFGASSTEAQARRNISYLPERFQPSRYLRGREYLSLSLSYFGKDYSEAKAHEEAIALDLAVEALERKVGSYSKGMGQKLGLMGAFMVGAPFVILDEPMSGLDPRARIKLKDRLLAQKAQGKTIFFSSHILSDIDEICDRIGVISQGKLIFVGKPSDFKHHFPSDTLEKSFLRSIAA